LADRSMPVRRAGTNRSGGHDFRHGFSVGIEEELLLVDPKTGRLAPVADEVLARCAVGRELVDHELYAAQLELRSGRAETVGEAVAALARARAAARQAGATLMGCGVHPAGSPGDAELVPEPRYLQVREMFRGLVARTPEAALHVHIGLPDPATAVRVYNGLRELLPLFAGLAANSPYWFGRDSGLASSRAALVRAYPTRGVPPAFPSFEAYWQGVEEVVRAAQVPDYTFVWWDVRLHPRLGTVEVREMDAQSSLEDVAALAALIQASAAALAEARFPEPAMSDVVEWSSFRASRDGVGATVRYAGEDRRLAEVAGEVVTRVSPWARDLDCLDALLGIERMVREGGGSGQQRSVLRRGGLSALLAHLVKLTANAGPG